ncbi:HAMP domain-containing histidine kinase [Myxococcota bacterium]|nr:HAMP domain-containing histidine kinase [Myxococcota bacterium]
MARFPDRLSAPRRVSPAPPAEDDLHHELDLAQKRIAELESELSRQARVRTELVHLVAHELRTPITVISGFSRLLLADDGAAALCSKQRHFVEESLKACRRLDRFVGDLMEAGTEGGTPLSIEIVESDLHATITAQLESLSPLLAERGMGIDLRLEPAMPRFAFDPRRIEQVVTNLVTNAIRYGRPKGLVRIETVLARDAAAHELARVAIEDDGSGIPENDRERLFAPYVRGEGRTKSGGLGIGLAICRRIVAAHGGEIHVEGGLLGGARFVFTLPTNRPGPVEH